MATVKLAPFCLGRSKGPPPEESRAEASDTLEDIGYSEKTETRVLIEKFVEENPDAAALLLRNWLNEDWE